jgi:hypothetical protein
LVGVNEAYEARVNGKFFSKLESLERVKTSRH